MKSSADGAEPFQFDDDALFDLAAIATGWCALGDGHGAEWVIDADRQQLAQKPSGDRDWRRGFKVNVVSEAMFGSESRREFSANTAGPCLGMEQLYADYLSGHSYRPNHLPLVRVAGVDQKKIGRGLTHIPRFQITCWVEADEGAAPAIAMSP